MPQFLILAKDFTDDEALARRLLVRNDHLARMSVEKVAGRFITGGATLDPNGKMNGSMVVIDVANEQAVREWLQDEPYITGRVWNEVDILPFRMADVP